MSEEAEPPWNVLREQDLERGSRVRPHRCNVAWSTEKAEGGILRCDLPAGHRGAHQADWPAPGHYTYGVEGRERRYWR